MSVFKLTAFAAAAIAAAATLAAAGPVLSQAASASGAFTADQVDKGGKVFADNCSACHGVDFAGGPGTPSLKGPEFMFGWNGKSVGELITYIHDNMPPGQAGSLSDQDYADITAAILASNGFTPGSAALTGTASASAGIKVGKP